MFEERKLIGQYLVENGIITEQQLKEAVNESKKGNQRFGDILVKKGWVSEEELAKALSEQLGFAFIDVSTYQFDLKSVVLIDIETAQKLQAIPVYKIANSLTVAMVDPLNVSAIDELERLTGMNINPVFATPGGVKKAISQYYKKSDKPAAKKGNAKVTIDDIDVPIPAGQEELPKLIEEATQAPVIQLVNDLISEAVQSKASDIHLEPQEHGFYCRYRVDGILQDFKPLEVGLQLATISRIKIMAGIDITERRLPQDGRAQINVDEKEIDLRIATFPTIYGEHVAIRILDKSTGILDMEDLGFDGDILTQFRNVVQKPHGIILVTGPTGSGKSTTLYSVLNTIRDSKKNIITLEDPVEYGIENVHQSQVNVKAGLTFSTGLRSVVRMDPDVIMIGEIRDAETAEIATHAALTGHLVFSTLHTNDSVSAFARLIDIGLEPFLISSSIKAILAQRLVRKLCGSCKESYQPGPEELDKFKLKSGILSGKMECYRSQGCDQCHNTGYSGRTGIYELLVPNDKIRDMVTKNASAHELLEEAKKDGMMTLLDDGLTKVKNGITSLAEILRVTEES